MTLMIIVPIQLLDAQKRKKTKTNSPAKTISLDAFQLRNVGPAFLSGRIADIKFHPENENIWSNYFILRDIKYGNLIPFERTIKIYESL